MEWSHAPLPCMVNAYLFQAPVQAGEPEDTILAVSRREHSLGSWGIALPCPSSTIISTDIERLRRWNLISKPANVTSRHQGLGEDLPVVGITLDERPSTASAHDAAAWT
jgi:hypothetical protein